MLFVMVMVVALKSIPAAGTGFMSTFSQILFFVDMSFLQRKLARILSLFFLAASIAS